MADLVITQISRAKIFKSSVWTSIRSASRAGFTLIEILIVLAIIGAAISIATPKLFQRKTNIKSVARNFVVLGKEVRNRARLTNSTMRLVLDMNPQEPKYWVEKSNGIQLVNPYAEKEDEDEDEKKSSPWAPDEVLTAKKKELPTGLMFGPVQTINMDKPQTEGTAYIHFFPEGLMEAASIQITDGKNMTWTLIYNPLTAQADIIQEARNLKDVKR